MWWWTRWPEQGAGVPRRPRTGMHAGRCARRSRGLGWGSSWGVRAASPSPTSCTSLDWGRAQGLSHSCPPRSPHPGPMTSSRNEEGTQSLPAPPQDGQFAGAAEGPLPVSRSRRGLLTFARAWARLSAARSWTAKYTTQRGVTRGGAAARRVLLTTRPGSAGAAAAPPRAGAGASRPGMLSQRSAGQAGAGEGDSLRIPWRGGIRLSEGSRKNRAAPWGGGRATSAVARRCPWRGTRAPSPDLPGRPRSRRSDLSRTAPPPAYLAGSAALGERGPGRHSRAGGLRGARTGRPAVKLRRGASHGSQSPGKRRRRASRATAPGARASRAGVPAAARSARRHT